MPNRATRSKTRRPLNGPSTLKAVSGHQLAGKKGRHRSDDLDVLHKKFEMVGLIESGLSAAFLDNIADDLDLPAVAVRRLAKISSSTLNRRKTAGRLSAQESDRAFRLRSIVDKTTDFFEGNKAAARAWLNRPAPALGGVRPIALLINEAGIREVESLLGRLDYGVFT
jgi:putative toxin-antitoxin system antitoxin component (TIGR02293 family)